MLEHKISHNLNSWAMVFRIWFQNKLHLIPFEVRAIYLTNLPKAFFSGLVLSVVNSSSLTSSLSMPLKMTLPLLVLLRFTCWGWNPGPCTG